MASESTGSCAAPSPFRKEALNHHNSPDRGACFHCKEEGHWIKDCPWRKKASPGPPGPDAGAANGTGYPELQCPCGQGACVVLTSRTEGNPNRDFYRCPLFFRSGQCKFFLWCDKAVSNGANSPLKLYQQHGDKSPVKQDQQYGYKSPMNAEKRYDVKSPMNPVKLEQRFNVNKPVKPEQRAGVNSPVKPGKRHYDTSESPYPMCSCGAGRCRLLTMQDGDDAGRKYFACTIKKGQGACNFFQWHDIATKQLEMKNQNLELNVAPSFNQAPEEENNPVPDAAKDHGIGVAGEANNPVHEKAEVHWMDGAGEAKDGGNDLVPNEAGDRVMVEAGVEKDSGGNPVPEATFYIVEDGGAAEANGGITPEGMLADVSVVPASPSPSIRVHQANRVGGEFSPMKRLSLHEGSPAAAATRPGKCFKCGKEGHWMSQCAGPAGAYPCFKCGKFGHWKKDCTM